MAKKFKTIDEIEAGLPKDDAPVKLRKGFIRKLADYIEGNGPDRVTYEQGTFCVILSDAEVRSLYKSKADKPEYGPDAVCRTAGCLAGNALVVAGLDPTKLKDIRSPGLISNVAQALMGLTDEAADRLFDGSTFWWPGRHAGTNPTRKRAAAMLRDLADGKVKLET